MIFMQARRDRSSWKRWQRAALCIGMGMALIAFVGVVYSEKENGSEKSMFTVSFYFCNLVHTLANCYDLSFLEESTEII
jgi:hypothetical protein